MYVWLWMSLASGILYGFYDIFKKKSLEKNSVFDVLALYSLCSFIIVSYEIFNAINIGYYGLLLILLKSFIIFISWIFSFMAIKNMPISIITPFGTASPMFSIILGILVLNEKLGFFQALGILIILVSYYLIGRSGSSEITGLFKNKYFYFMVGSTFLSALSALIDKIVLKTVNPGQMQFWFSLFTTILYFAVMIYIRKKDKTIRAIQFNPYILLMSIAMVFSDRIYYNAVNIPLSQISIIIPLRKISVFVSAIIGGVVFKERNLKQKFLYICLLIVGIAVVIK